MRNEGWESRLNEVIDAARGKPYQLGIHDCFKVSCQVIEALTGVDRWPEFEGRYTDYKSALALLAQHGSSFEEAFDWFFQTPRISVKLARRGDICAFAAGGYKHLGVNLGRRTTFLAPKGLLFVPTEKCLCAWAVG